ncbi:hypothetical protein C2U69_16985 [Cupriavidus pinatubonensis]|nr:hypothetical protein C2U69_16985 [Cupriavidus pinatubonensis]
MAFILFPPLIFCQTNSDVYCFRSASESGKSSDFEIHTYYDQISKWSGGFVRYRNSRQPITVVFRDRLEEELSKDRPYQVTTTWLEIRGKKITGEYEMMSQGAIIYSMTYTNYRNSKKTAFLFDPNVSASIEFGCEW